jgi:putative transposase
MGQSLVKNYLHITFSTKHRKPDIIPSVESELHRYVGGICRRMQCYPVIVGGYIDHLHILCQLSKKIALATLLREVKAHSSAWMKEQDEKLKKFYWQNGYGAFSVNPHQIDIVRSYIQRQHQHLRARLSRMNSGPFLKSIR